MVFTMYLHFLDLPESPYLVFSSFDFKLILPNCFAVASNKSCSSASSIEPNISLILGFFSRPSSMYVNAIVFLQFFNVFTIFTATTPAWDDAAEEKSVDLRNRKSYNHTATTHLLQSFAIL